MTTGTHRCATRRIRLPALAALPAFITIALSACGTASADGAADREDLRARLLAVTEQSGAEVGLYYRSLSDGGDSVLINPDLRMHAASTMKVPVMMRLVLDAQEGVRSLDTPVRVTNTFSSIVDGSPFEMTGGADSDSTLYARLGTEMPVRDLIDPMITWSSNLATNILIELADPARINRMLRGMGADSMEVLRGVEDIKAFRAGLSNTTTARDLGTVMGAVAESDVFTPESRGTMIEILERQHFRGAIPAGVPPGTSVGNKTGWINGIQHDAAIVFPERAPPYVLVVTVRGHPAEDQGEGMAADLSRIVWEHHAGG